MRGIGWVILFEDPVTERLTNHWVSLHQDGIPARCKPLLVMDVWEHAFMRLQSFRARQVRGGVLQERRLVGRRPATSRSHHGTRVRGLNL
jgi:hypothetical protein